MMHGKSTWCVNRISTYEYFSNFCVKLVDKTQNHQEKCVFWFQTILSVNYDPLKNGICFIKWAHFGSYTCTPLPNFVHGSIEPVSWVGLMTRI